MNSNTKIGCVKCGKTNENTNLIFLKNKDNNIIGIVYACDFCYQIVKESFIQINMLEKNDLNTLN